MHAIGLLSSILFDSFCVGCSCISYPCLIGWSLFVSRLSDNAYLLVAEVLKKIVALAPFICCHFINELSRSMQNLTVCAMNVLHLYEVSEKAILSTSSANSMAVLRVV